MEKYDMTELRSLIAMKYKTIAAFADAAGLERSTVSRLLDRGDWKASQITKAQAALEIPDSFLRLYFFTPKGAKCKERKHESVVRYLSGSWPIFRDS